MRHIEKLKKIFTCCGKECDSSTNGEALDHLLELAEAGELGSSGGSDNLGLYFWTTPSSSALFFSLKDQPSVGDYLVKSNDVNSKIKITSVVKKFCWGQDKIYFDKENVEVGDITLSRYKYEDENGDLVHFTITVTAVNGDTITVSCPEATYLSGDFKRNSSFDCYDVNDYIRYSGMDATICYGK